MPTASFPASPRVRETLVLGSLLVSLLGGLVLAGFVLFPGCSQRCCETGAVGVGDAKPVASPIATAVPNPTPAATPVAAASPAAAPAALAVAPKLEVPEADKSAASHLHNYFRLSPRIASGAAPEVEEDFAALAAAGIQSIVTVDGTRPDVEGAKKHGLRYVHIPIGYDGISDARALELAKTFELLAPSGPIFVHCHHGKHRGPAACSIARILLDGITPDQAVAEMRRAGTDPKYRGLYESIATYRRPSAEQLAAVRAEMPESVSQPGIADEMVAIDQMWERMKAVRTAKWSAPAEHADLDPENQATLLAERFRELARRPEVAVEDEDFHSHLAHCEQSSWALSKALAKGNVDADAASKAFDACVACCTACHASHRDNTHRVRGN